MMRVFALASMILLAACGGGESTPKATAPSPTPTVVECPDEVHSLLDKLREIDSRLDVGLIQSDYSEYVADASVEYGRIDIEALNSGCVEEVGLQLEDALNLYIEVNGLWDECIDDYDCEMDNIQSEMQRKWQGAGDEIEEAADALR